MIKFIPPIVLLSIFFSGVSAFSCYQCADGNDGNGCQGFDMNYSGYVNGDGSSIKSAMTRNGKVDFINTDCPADTIGCILIKCHGRSIKLCASQNFSKCLSGSEIEVGNIQHLCVQQRSLLPNVMGCLCLEDECNKDPPCNVDMEKDFDMCYAEKSITLFKRALATNEHSILGYGHFF